MYGINNLYARRLKFVNCVIILILLHFPQKGMLCYNSIFPGTNSYHKYFHKLCRRMEKKTLFHDCAAGIKTGFSANRSH